MVSILFGESCRLLTRMQLQGFPESGHIARPLHRSDRSSCRLVSHSCARQGRQSMQRARRWQRWQMIASFWVQKLVRKRDTTPTPPQYIDIEPERVPSDSHETRSVAVINQRHGGDSPGKFHPFPFDRPSRSHSARAQGLKLFDQRLGIVRDTRPGLISACGVRNHSIMLTGRGCAARVYDLSLTPRTGSLSAYGV